MQEHVTSQATAELIEDALAERFGDGCGVDSTLPGLEELARIARHRVHRRFQSRPVEPALLRLLCACALSAPSKSDLQQADILVVQEKAKQNAIAARIPDMPWIAQAPVFLMFLANGGRLPQVAAMRGKPFPNDHLDLFFNAVVDSAIVLATFMRAAAAVGLGCCPISAVRDQPERMSELLELPERVIPVAGLCVGWPAEEGSITPRLPLALTLHQDRYETRGLASEIDAYDLRRAKVRPYARQRALERWGHSDLYGWSEDKARQYAEPLRAGFGTYVRAKGFCLD
jgi:nitroreductase/FMN reductase [NAD(P)H]